MTRHDPLSTQTSDWSPFCPFFELARRVAHERATFTRLSRRARASRVCEAEKRVGECVCDSTTVRFAPSTLDGRCCNVKYVRRAKAVSTTVAALSNAKAGVMANA